MKRVVVFIADGSEEVETLTPVDYLRRAGADVALVAVSESRTVTMSHKVSVNADITLDAYLPSADGNLPDAVVVPGGLGGSKNIANTRSALSLIDEMNKAGKLVCAICAAPALVLGKTAALEGKKWTCYPGMSEEAGKYATSHVDSAFVHDGNLITGRAAGAAEEFSMEIARTLCGEEAYSKVKNGTVQR